MRPWASLLGVPFWRPPRRCPGFDPPLGIGYFFNPTFDFPNETPKNLGYFLPLSSATFAIARISLRSSLVKSFGHFTSRTPLSVQQPSAQENLRVFFLRKLRCPPEAARPRIQPHPPWSGRAGGSWPAGESFQIVQTVAQRPERRLVVLTVDRDVASGALDRGRGLSQRHHLPTL